MARAIALIAIGTFFFASNGYSQTQAFTVTATPSSLTIYPGQQNVPVTITVNSGDNDNDNYTGPVVVTLTGLPSGITVTPVTLTPGSSGALYLNASVSAGQEGFPPVTASRNTSWTASATVVGAAGSTQATAPFAITVSISNPSYVPADSAINLPIVNINTSGVPIVNKTTDVPGTISITSPDGQTSYLPNSSDSDNTATFHVHGNSTSNMPKLPYHVKLNTSLDLLSTMGLSCSYIAKGKPTCDKSKSYVLLANYDDKTFLRDWAASALANAIPYGGSYLNETPVPSPNAGTIPTPSGTSTLMPWAPHSLFVELYLNGVYEGNYQLIEEVKVDSHRVNITEITSPSTTSGAALTGGYLLEIDQENGEDFMFTTPKDVDIGLVDPDFSPEVPEQTSYISNYVTTAEDALYSSNFTDPTLGWRAYFDEASAINFYIVNDVMGNVDGGKFYSSDYFYKDINNPLLYMGPIWDFDISSGNSGGDSIVNPSVPWMQAYAPWYVQWFKDPGFKADVVTQWNALKSNGVFTTWLTSIQQEASSLEQSQVNNFGRWPMQGIAVWPNSQVSGSYNGEVSYLTNWLNFRIAYLDSTFNNKAQTATTLNAPGGTLRNGSAMTLTAEVTGGASLSGSVSFLSNGASLGTAALSGNTASLTTSNLPAGTDSLEAVYSGDADNGLSVSKPQSVTVAPPLIGTATSLAESSPTLNQIIPANFTVSVVGNSGTTVPTGNITLTVNGIALGSTSLTGNAAASLSTPLPVGVDSITAVYSGDTDYQGSTSNLLSANIIGAPDFTLAASSSYAGISSSLSSKTMLTLTPQYGFNQSVSLSCSGQSAGVSCSLSPATVTLGSGPVTSVLTLSLSGKTQASLLSLPYWSKLGGSIAVALLLWPFRRRRLRLLVALAAMFTVGLTISACGTSETMTNDLVTITAAGGGITHTASIKLSVTQ
jgi:hypothetical protein